jgi:putative endonuclease
MTNKSKGMAGEGLAAAALEKAGLRIAARNVRSRVGEIDLIALDGDTVVFVEVKNWPASGAGNLEYGINEKKQKRIIETAKYFLFSHREYNDRPVRFDVVFFHAGAMTHFVSAFMETQ